MLLAVLKNSWWCIFFLMVLCAPDVPVGLKTVATLALIFKRNNEKICQSLCLVVLYVASTEFQTGTSVKFVVQAFAGVIMKRQFPQLHLFVVPLLVVSPAGVLLKAIIHLSETPLLCSNFQVAA